MKIGIMTFHRALNYGAVLQCYALQNSLQKLGANVEVIDYKNKFISRFYSPFYIERITPRKIAYTLYAFRSKVKRNQIFSKFRNDNLILSERKYTQRNIKESDTQYEVIIVGSDQVWNLEQTQGDLNYLLKFAESAKRVSYAASFGIEKLPKEQERYFERELQGFAAISVREKSGVEIVNNLTKKKSVICIDPTLLLTKEDWIEVADSDKQNIFDNYICVYKINSSEAYVYANYLAQITGLKVVVIKPERTCPKQFVKQMYASPAKFLSLIKNARYVITDSFHGTVFSIIFEKQFLVCLDSRKNNKNTRIIELLEVTDLLNHLVDNVEDVMVAMEERNYMDVEKKLFFAREQSIRYLNDIVNS